MEARISHGRAGLIYGLSAYIIWGFLPVFFKLLHSVSAGEIVAQRILWSLVLLAALIGFSRRLPHLRIALRNPVALRFLALSAALIATNWLVYIWAVLNDHILQASLGYFLNPLVNVALGVIFLKERLGRAQTVAVALAAAGVIALAAGAGEGLWISLTLAFSFGIYGLLRKMAPVEAIEGLSIETMILAPVALGWVLWLSVQGDVAFGADLKTSLLLVIGGVVTAVPLLLFAAAARRMPYATLGLLQYIAPTIAFLLAVFAYGEPLTTAHILCFVLIWTGLGIYTASALVGMRRVQVTEPA
jgi:chloramphenicol-sensitive protein RarD